MRFWIITGVGAFIALSVGLLPLNTVQTFLRRFFPMASTHIEYVRMGLVISGVEILLINAGISKNTLSRTENELESNRTELTGVKSQLETVFKEKQALEALKRTKPMFNIKFINVRDNNGSIILFLEMKKSGSNKV
jgi:hypothetical protein